MRNKNPTQNRDNGRDGKGRFAKGNPGGPGNPYAKAVGQLRNALLQAVTTEDMATVVRKLIELAKDGNVQAIRELLDRTLGKAQEADLIERIEALEQRLLHTQEGKKQ